MSEHSDTGGWSADADSVVPEFPTVPGYEILAELGRGGMGVVYKARRSETGELVALKLIRDGALAGSVERARFRIEAEAALRIRHPNVVPILDVGERLGLPYFAMELVEDGSLESLQGGRPQPPRVAAELVRTLALAVEHAHSLKIIHRDLKPANILLRRQASPDVSSLAECIPLITDFGLAKRLDSDSTAWTADGAILGTASYMAPEQAAGNARDAGPLVDVYALGAVLYELLTGQPPFRAEVWTQTVQQVLFDEPAPPTRLQPGIPAALEAVCLRCLEKDPNRRYSSAGELAADLQRFLEDGSVKAVRQDPEERLRRIAERDGCRLLRELGRGPRSVVHHAQFDSIQQPLVVKVFHPGCVSKEEWDARLARSVDVWAAVSHPQVVPILRAGWWDGAAYVAMEYVPQRSLWDLLQGKPASLTQALQIAEQVGDVVSYLHRQGVVHGNLKASNVLMGASGIPRLADFRISGGCYHGSPHADDAEPAGVSYLAPEVLHDPDAEARPYTDFYGLGVVLYELLTGRGPFQCGSASEAREVVHSQEPARPSTLNPQVPEELDWFCLRCLRKDPWRRSQRAHDLVRSLREYRERFAAGGDARTFESARR